ncbi:serine/threonine protein kinase, partial [Micromonospora sp. DH15]|nr:serine/threonine protein kinase [Micromonospora sp. DH15]
PPQRSRSGAVWLFILVATLVLLCSGVISYNLRKNAAAGDPGGSGARAVASGALQAGGRDDPSGTPYRRVERLLPGGGETTTSEGRQTR